VIRGILFCVVLVAVGCNPSKPAQSQSPVATAPVETVHAWFEPLASGWHVAADPSLVLVVENRTAKPLRVNRFVATNTPLALEGTDEHAARIPLGPPPMPREFVEADFVTIAPGTTELFPISVQSLRQLSKGRYHIVSREFPSATLDFEVP
jgi:hypothetical protein